MFNALIKPICYDKYNSINKKNTNTNTITSINPFELLINNEINSFDTEYNLQFNKYLIHLGSVEAILEGEIKNDHCIKRQQIDPLTWWREIKDCNMIKEVVMELLAIPAESSASERVFSRLKLLIGNHRHSLDTNRVNSYVTYAFRFASKNNKVVNNTFNSPFPTFGDILALEKVFKDLDVMIEEEDQFDYGNDDTNNDNNADDNGELYDEDIPDMFLQRSEPLMLNLNLLNKRKIGEIL